MAQWHGGKGSSPRPFSVDKKKFDDNWDKIFGKKENKEEKKEDDEKVVDTDSIL